MADHGKDSTRAALVEAARALDLLLVHQRSKAVGMKKEHGPVEARWRYAEDGERMLVHLDYAPYQAAIVLKVAVPELIREHDVRRAVRSMLVGAMEEAPQIRLNAEGVEIVSARLLHPRMNRILSGIQSTLPQRVCDQSVEAAIAVAQIEIVGIRLES